MVEINGVGVSQYLVAYDIVESRRRAQVARFVYAYALGGQKSVLELPIDKTELKFVVQELGEKIDCKTDKVNIIKVEEAILLGSASALCYDNGMILL